MTIARRRMLELSALAAVGAVSAGGATAAARTRRDKPMLELPPRNELFARMRGAPGGRPGLWWFAGTLWGKRTLDAAKMLFAVEGCSFNRLLLEADGSVRMTMIEIGFWLDPLSKQPADAWLNPMNGLACAPVHFMGPQALLFDPSGVGRPTGAIPPGTEFDGRITEPVTSGDMVWVGETLIVKGPGRANATADPLQSGLPVFTATSLDTYSATRQDLAADAAQWLPAGRSYQTLGSWYPWMRMGHEAGGISFQMVGRKLRTVAELPSGLRRLIDERRPGWLQEHAA